jgi:hypothetical protein
MVFRPEQNSSLRPLHSSVWLNTLSEANLSLDLLPLCLRGDGYVAPKDHIDLIHLIFIIGVGLTMFVTSLMFKHVNYNLIIIVNQQIKSKISNFFEFKFNSSQDLYLNFYSNSFAIQSMWSRQKLLQMI